MEVRQESLPALEPNEMLVETLLSAISPGTEMLIYGGMFPDEMNVDDSIAALSGAFSYPLKYGYAAVGRVMACGRQVEATWMGRLVFAFHPHETHFSTTPEAVFPIPDEISPEQAVFLPNVETAINLVMDGSPLIGERVAVFGQGIVGLFTAALLRRFPLDRLLTVDRYGMRRKASRSLDVSASLDPDQPDLLEQVRSIIPTGVDLCYELSGAPAALNQAIAVTGFDGRIVIGSWYGKKTAELNLGGAFHRSRMRLVSSQVSTWPPP
jgi:2-desacetyl-2-hydroxyethyl bacteriochlorophyllide A dehydrogenase